MTPSRLAFVQEFERELGSPSLRHWFGALRDQELVLKEFPDPVVLRQFLHSHHADARKPEVWRALVRGVQRRRSPEAVLFVIGLLEPALGTLVDGFEGRDLDADDLWQEAIRGALAALANPRLPERQAVLLGFIRDTRKHVYARIRIVLSNAEEEAPLFGLSYETNFDEALNGDHGESLLMEWCHRAGISSDNASLICTTRIAGLRLSEIAPVHSALYQRLKKRRNRAEARLRSWLSKSQARPLENRMSHSGR